jgi:uncharacterized lipoprotein YajG
MFKRFLILLLLAGSCCAWASSERLEGIPLVWKPKIGLGGIHASELANVKVEFLPFKDVRKNPRVIAQNREKKNEPRSVTTRDDVGAFVRKHVKSSLAAAGLNVVESDGEVKIGGEVQSFWVNETNRYYANVKLGVTVINRAGKVLWTGVASGSAKHMGRSYKAENYYEALSDAVLGATHQLATNPGFRAALKNH